MQLYTVVPIQVIFHNRWTSVAKVWSIIFFLTSITTKQLSIVYPDPTGKATDQVKVVKDFWWSLHLPKDAQHLLVKVATIVLEVHLHFHLELQAELFACHLLQVFVEHHLTKLVHQELLKGLAVFIPGGLLFCKIWPLLCKLGMLPNVWWLILPISYCDI